MLEMGDEMLTIRRLIGGVLLFIVTVAVALLITAISFDKNTYFFAQLLPLFMASYLLLAWFIYLRQDNLSSLRRRYRPRVEMLGHNEVSALKDISDKVLVVEPYLDSNLLRPGKSDSPETEAKDPLWKDSLYTLLWSACLLALLATALYNFFGYGANYFVR